MVIKRFVFSVIFVFPSILILLTSFFLWGGGGVKFSLYLIFPFILTITCQPATAWLSWFIRLNQTFFNIALHFVFHIKEARVAELEKQVEEKKDIVNRLRERVEGKK